MIKWGVKMEQLEKIDLVRERTGCSYEEAQKALIDNNWDVIEAIIALEKCKNRTEKDTVHVKGKELTDKIKYYIKQGNVTKIVVKKDGQKIVSIPVNGSLIVTIFFPYLVALSAIIVLAADYELEIERAAYRDADAEVVEPEDEEQL